MATRPSVTVVALHWGTSGLLPESVRGLVLAVKEYERINGANPLALIGDELAAAWGDPEQARRVSWPLALRVGRVGE